MIWRWLNFTEEPKIKQVTGVWIVILFWIGYVILLLT